MRSARRRADVVLESATREVLRGWLERPRYEVMPVAGLVDEVAAQLTEPTTLTVTITPHRGTGATLDLTEQLAGLGHRVVPHLAARQLSDEAEAKDVVDRLTAAGVEEVFVVGGDVERPAGEYADAVGLIEALARIAPQLRIGIAGYPESHPRISDDLAIQAMWDKRRYASYVVSQICFDPAAFTGWVDRIRLRGIRLPVLAGVPGPVPTSRLLRVGMRIGVGASLRFLHGHSGMLRLATPGAYLPDAFLAALAAAPEGQHVAGVHVFTFNAIAATEAWRRDLLAELQEDVA
jgi:methylenetetrahydrofolate reductase (NADPH)